LGMFAYVAPELLRGLPPHPRSDVYAFGVTAHFMLSGVLPFQGPDLSDFMKQHLDVKPPPLPSDVPPELSALVMRCLEKEPAKRLADGAALVAALRSLAFTPVVAKPRRSRGVALAVLGTVALLAAPLLAIARPWEPASQARWLIRLGRAEDALTSDVTGRALALEALGRTDELKALVQRECLALATSLEPAERRRLGVSLSACR
jgi:Protein kinase domain